MTEAISDKQSGTVEAAKSSQDLHLIPAGEVDGAKDVVDRAAMSDKRWALLRDVTVFQGKLLLDSARDVLLSPISIGLAIYGLVADKERPGKQFYRLMKLGRRSDRIINLFAADENDDAKNADELSVDQVVDRLETMVKKQYEKGGITKSAKDAVDQAIDKAQDELSRVQPKSGGS